MLHRCMEVKWLVMKQNNIYGVLQERRCMSCGMCRSICPVQAITLAYMKDGFFRPQIDKEKCINCGKCLQSCPAEHQGSSSLIGGYKHLYLAHCCNPDIRHNATSGGVINSLLRFLLETDTIEAALATRYSAGSVIEAEPILITRAYLSDLTGQTREYASRYVSVPVLGKIKEYLKVYKKLAVVGTPCQIKALNLGLGIGEASHYCGDSCCGDGGCRIGIVDVGGGGG